MSTRPAILPALDVSALKAQRLAEFKQLLPTWNTDLESDPVVKLIELLAYVETLDSAAENEDILSNLLVFAKDARLDELAKWYQLERLPDEIDERFRTRLELHIRGLSGMGTEDYYRAQAMAVGLWVRDARVDVDRWGALTITVWLAGDAPADALAQASRHLTDKSRRMATDTVSVVAAVPRDLAISARLYRAAGTPAARVDEAAQSLQNALISAVGLGADIATSWIIGRLALSGISRVELDAPLADLVCAGHEFPRVVRIDIRDGGLV